MDNKLYTIVVESWLKPGSETETIQYSAKYYLLGMSPPREPTLNELRLRSIIDSFTSFEELRCQWYESNGPHLAAHIVDPSKKLNQPTGIPKMSSPAEFGSPSPLRRQPNSPPIFGTPSKIFSPTGSSFQSGQTVDSKTSQPQKTPGSPSANDLWKVSARPPEPDQNPFAFNDVTFGKQIIDNFIPADYTSLAKQARFKAGSKELELFRGLAQTRYTERRTINEAVKLLYMSFDQTEKDPKVQKALMNVLLRLTDLSTAANSDERSEATVAEGTSQINHLSKALPHLVKVKEHLPQACSPELQKLVWDVLGADDTQDAMS